VFQRLTLYNLNYSRTCSFKDVYLMSIVYFASCGKNCSEVILSVAVHNCLKWWHDKFKTHDKFGMHDLAYITDRNV